MNKDKQIEEMAKDMCWEGADCSKCEGLLPCDKKYYVQRLVDKGYRKASDVAREIIGEIEKVNNLFCTTLGSVAIKRTLAELKKKYTSEK